jgi:hypothetical protein
MIVAQQAALPPPPLGTAQGHLFEVPVEQLRFDQENPRFVDFAGGDDNEIVKFL